MVSSRFCNGDKGGSTDRLRVAMRDTSTSDAITTHVKTIVAFRVTGPHFQNMIVSGLISTILTHRSEKLCTHGLQTANQREPYQRKTPKRRYKPFPVTDFNNYTEAEDTYCSTSKETAQGQKHRMPGGRKPFQGQPEPAEEKNPKNDPCGKAEHDDKKLIHCFLPL
jgi:hypothetical protein